MEIVKVLQNLSIIACLNYIPNSSDLREEALMIFN